MTFLLPKTFTHTHDPRLPSTTHAPRLLAILEWFIWVFEWFMRGGIQVLPGVVLHFRPFEIWKGKSSCRFNFWRENGLALSSLDLVLWRLWQKPQNPQKWRNSPKGQQKSRMVSTFSSFYWKEGKILFRWVLLFHGILNSIQKSYRALKSSTA